MSKKNSQSNKLDGSKVVSRVTKNFNHRLKIAIGQIIKLAQEDLALAVKDFIGIPVRLDESNDCSDGYGRDLIIKEIKLCDLKYLKEDLNIDNLCVDARYSTGKSNTHWGFYDLVFVRSNKLSSQDKKEKGNKKVTDKKKPKEKKKDEKKKDEKKKDETTPKRVKKKKKKK